MPPVTLTPKKKRPLVIKPRSLVQKATFDPAALERFKDVFEEVEEGFVERGEEIEAVRYCLLTRSHLMLDGLHGTGKSMLASRIFSRITGGAVFQKMLMKMTERDEVFGPMLSERYRKEGVYEHNIKGHLPTAHFAFLDEVYRASDFLLPAMLGVLNERHFMNGTKFVRCPLMTAIGTTNFITESSELAAFNDRWHVRVKVAPLTSSSSVSRMLSTFLVGEVEYEQPAEISLDDLKGLQEAVCRVTIPEDVVALYGEIVQNLGNTKGSGVGYISDRRKCIALRFIQASALLRESHEANAEDVAACRYSLVEIRNEAHERIWNTHFGNAKSNFDAFHAESVLLKRIEKWAKQQEAAYDPDMAKKDAQALWAEVQEGFTAFQNQPPAEQPKTEMGKNRKANVMRKVQNLLESLSTLVTL